MSTPERGGSSVGGVILVLYFGYWLVSTLIGFWFLDLQYRSET